MRTVGFINAFDELAEADQRIGRKVANLGLTEALIEHCSAEELHFFLPFYNAVGPFERGYGELIRRRGGPVRLLPAVKLPWALAQAPYDALHSAEMDRYFAEMCHLRNRFAARPFPVTCTTHTLSYWASQVNALYKVLPGALACDAVFCTSRAARDHLRAAYGHAAGRLRELGLEAAGFGGRLEIVPLGVRAADFAGRDQAAARAELGLAAGPPVVLVLGRLTPSDKYDLMPAVGALAGLGRQRELHLVLAGGQSKRYGQDLVEAAESLGLAGRVHLFADFPSRLKPALYAAADVFLSPADNLQETFGLTILEAMAAGLPVVASDFSGYRDLVVHGETGFLAPTLGPADHGLMDAAWPVMAEFTAALQTAQRTAVDLEALAAAVAELVDRPELRRSMGEAGRRRVARRFDWAVVVRAMEERWQALAARAPKGPPRPLPANVLDAGQARLFGHFPTRAIGPADRLAPGLLAGAFRQGRWAGEPFSDLAELLPAPALAQVLAAAEALGRDATLAAVQKRLAAKLPGHLVEHLALHGLKYGVLRLA
jgi:glycosyltransferase involved in cell wall biosynthesis